MFAEGQEILEKRYKVIKRLGGGAFGEIYRGKNHSITNEEIFKLFIYSGEEKDWRASCCQSGK